MRLAIDIDGVLRDFCGALIAQYKIDFPGHRVGFINQWELEHFFPIGKEIYEYAFNTRAQEIFEDADEFVGAMAFLKHLKEAGHHVALISSQPNTKIIHTVNWITAHGAVYDSLVFTWEKGLFNYDILLDDAEKNLKNARDNGRRAVCFDQPYNENWDGERVKTYQEFLEIVDEISS